LTNPSGSYGQREYFDRAWFESTREARIGHDVHPVPVGVESLLSHIYGDYLTPIPANQIERELRFLVDHYVTPLRSTGVIE